MAADGIWDHLLPSGRREVLLPAAPQESTEEPSQKPQQSSPASRVLPEPMISEKVGLALIG